MASHGLCTARFETIRDEFERNFADRGEVGASVCVTIEGETVVDLWGGMADPVNEPRGNATRSEWCGRARRARRHCARTCSRRGGELDLDTPVAALLARVRVKRQRAATTVAMLLAHQAGLVGFR